MKVRVKCAKERPRSSRQ